FISVLPSSPIAVAAPRERAGRPPAGLAQLHWRPARMAIPAPTCGDGTQYPPEPHPRPRSSYGFPHATLDAIALDRTAQYLAYRESYTKRVASNSTFGYGGA